MPDSYSPTKELRQFLRTHGLALASFEAGRIAIAASSQVPEPTLSALRFVFQLEPDILRVSPAELEVMLLKDDLTARQPGEGWQGTNRPVLVEDDPVVRLVNATINEAAERGASDIHIEPNSNRLQIRYAVDGKLEIVRLEDPAIAASVISRLKILGEMDVADSTRPQDGRARWAQGSRLLDLRIATAPTPFGESGVIRLLDPARPLQGLSALGFEQDDQSRIASLMARPHGLVLLTGPTGSGKTTTLYSLLAGVDVVQRKVVTIEDPIEYHLEGVVQVQVNEAAGITFASMLRSFLRHAPNVILLGEIRDPETARIAVQAALTGHLVLSTLHTNDAASAIARLLDMGIEPYLLAATLEGVVAQRLVGRLCQHCSQSTPVLARVAGVMRAKGIQLDEQEVFAKSRGCQNCRQTGYSGRVAVAEVFEANADLVMLGAESIERLRERLRASGVVSIAEDGLRKARAGLVAIDDVARVVAQ